MVRCALALALLPAAQLAFANALMPAAISAYHFNRDLHFEWYFWRAVRLVSPTHSCHRPINH